MNAKNCNGQTPLYIAMASSDHSISISPFNQLDGHFARIARLLIDAGATVDEKDMEIKHIGETALFRAARKQRHKCIEVLLSAGADVNVISNMGDTILHVYRKDAHHTIELINSCGVTNINARNKEGNTALHVRVMHSDTGNSVTLVLNAGADPMIFNNEGLTPLHVACRYGKVRSIERLLAHGVDINTITGTRAQKSEEEKLASRSKSKEKKQSNTLQWEQVQGAKQEMKSAVPFSNAGALDTPLHLACRHAQAESIHVLLRHKIPPNTLARNSHGKLPIEECYSVDAPITRLLLEAMSQQSSDVDKIALNNTGGNDVIPFEDNLSFIFSKFMKLQQLRIDNCQGLRNLPPSISKLSSLEKIRLVECSNLRSLPDEMGFMAQLQHIEVENCLNLEFPPQKLCEGRNKTQKIKEYLKQSYGATPQRSVKVLLLGNGRSGKTSVLRMLAKMPLQPGDAGPESTRGVSGLS